MIQNDAGFVLLHKPSGRTSFDALSEIKKAVHPRKVGHTGTLDKFAEGLLIAVLGKATKFSAYITGLEKEYTAEIEFGRETDTLDPEGSFVRENCGIPDFETIAKAAGELQGDQLQTPPDFSAVHVNGERAYRLALKGQKTRLEARPVTIYGMNILSFSPPFLQILISCSKGTYIRSIARDLGKRCGSCAYVVKLKRTKIGDFSVSESVLPSEFVPENNIIPIERMLERIGTIQTLSCKEEAVQSILYGKPVQEYFFTEIPKEDGIYAAVDEKNGRFLALVERKDSSFAYKFVGVQA